MKDITFGINEFQECWFKFKDYYFGTSRLFVKPKLGEEEYKSDGTPSREIWSEQDIQFILAKIIDEYILNQIYSKNKPIVSGWVHLEEGLGKYSCPRADIIIMNPENNKAIIKYNEKHYDLINSNENHKYEMIIEIAILSTKGKDNTYGINKIKDIASKYQDRCDLAKKHVICFIDKISETIYEIDEFKKCATESFKLFPIFDIHELNKEWYQLLN